MKAVTDEPTCNKPFRETFHHSIGYSIVSGASDLPSGVKIVIAVLTPLARTMLTVTFVPSEVDVMISEPLVRKVFFKTVMKCVRAVSRSSAAIVTNINLSDSHRGRLRGAS